MLINQSLQYFQLYGTKEGVELLPYSGKFLRGSMFCGFRREFYREKKEPMKFEHVHSKHFALCTWGQTAVKEVLERKQDLTLSIYRYLRPVNSLP